VISEVLKDLKELRAGEFKIKGLQDQLYFDVVVQP